MLDICPFCHSSENLIRAYRIMETYAGEEFTLYFSCCRRCLHRLEPGYTVIDDDESKDTGRPEIEEKLVAGMLCNRSEDEKRGTTRRQEPAEKSDYPYQLKLFDEEKNIRPE